MATKRKSTEKQKELGHFRTLVVLEKKKLKKLL